MSAEQNPGYLNLGGVGGGVSRAFPARTIDTTFQPPGAAVGRPVLVTLTIQLNTTNAADRIRVEVRCDTSNPPTTVVGQVELGPQIGASGAQVSQSITFFCPPFGQCRAFRQQVIGLGAAAILNCTEVTL